jgi:hypothetical protein
LEETTSRAVEATAEVSMAIRHDKTIVERTDTLHPYTTLSECALGCR